MHSSIIIIKINKISFEAKTHFTKIYVDPINSIFIYFRKYKELPWIEQSNLQNFKHVLYLKHSYGDLQHFKHTLMDNKILIFLETIL